MIHQSLELNFNTPCIEVCKNDICFKTLTLRSWSCSGRLTQNQHAKCSKIILSWTQIHPLSLNNRCWPDKLLLRPVNRALSHRAHAREKEQMIERQMTDWKRDKYYLVNGLVHTKTSLLFIQTVYQQPSWQIHMLISDQPIACLVASYIF